MKTEGKLSSIELISRVLPLRWAGLTGQVLASHIDDTSSSAAHQGWWRASQTLRSLKQRNLKSTCRRRRRRWPVRRRPEGNIFLNFSFMSSSAAGERIKSHSVLIEFPLCIVQVLSSSAESNVTSSSLKKLQPSEQEGKLI